MVKKKKITKKIVKKAVKKKSVKKITQIIKTPELQKTYTYVCDMCLKQITTEKAPGEHGRVVGGNVKTCKGSWLQIY